VWVHGWGGSEREGVSYRGVGTAVGYTESPRGGGVFKSLWMELDDGSVGFGGDDGDVGDVCGPVHQREALGG